MPIKSDFAQFEAAIIAITPLQWPLLGIVTADHEIHLYNLSTHTKEKVLRLKIPDEAKLYCAFDPFNHRFAFGTDRSESVHLIDLNQKKITRRFELEEQHPTTLAFDPSGSYLVCGTDQGRVLLWRNDSSTLIARMHSFPEYAPYSTIKPKFNFVSAIAFEENLVATTGYGGSIVLTDYRSQTQTQRLHPGHVKNGALLFYKNSLIAGNQSGTILKLDCTGKSPNQRLSTAMGLITHLLPAGADPYILAASEQRRIILIDADELKVVHERYIELDEPITALSKDQDNKIYIGTAKGELFCFDIQPLNQLDALIESAQYAEAYRFTRQEPLLQKSGSYAKLESIFEKERQSARIALEKGESEKAKTILHPFLSVKSKEISALTTAYAQMERLAYLFKQQKFSPFYGLIEQYPLLRSTSLFLQAEKLWSEQFAQAQKLMLVGKSKEAKAQLQLFTAVTAKSALIQLLLQHFDVLKQCSKAIHNHDYRTLMQLSRRYPVIRKLPSYSQLISEAGELVRAITDAIKAKEFEQASFLLDELAGVVQYEKDFERLKIFASHASNLHHAIAHSHWRSAYRMIDSHPELMILPWANELEAQWHQKLRQCETYAIRADVSAIRRELSNLINLPMRHERIGDILRTAYQIQLKLILRSDSAKFASGVKNYCELFGMDTELRYLLKTAQMQGVTVTLQPVMFLLKKRDQWLGSITTLPDQIA